MLIRIPLPRAARRSEPAPSRPSRPSPLSALPQQRHLPVVPDLGVWDPNEEHIRQRLIACGVRL
ncbi:hypothetical protein [Streptomyces sp. NPDC088775]|uniref:hypothetical protein n=1 Tax=Streptomyces sp. NPDC088775 TaxID=3365896 RepID=UPI0037FDF97B